MSNPFLEAALIYATNKQRPLFVFPCEQNKTKRPRVSKRFAADGKNWGMSNNPETLKEYWKKWPDSNVCIVTGEINGLFVVETDTKEGHDVDGATSLEKLKAENNNEWPDTLIARSPTGSIHYYFTWPDGDFIIRNSDSKLAPGVDVRGDGGMVVAPPSIRDSKNDPRCYEWISPEGQGIANAPEWLIKLIAEQPTYAKSGEPQADINKLEAAMERISNDKKDMSWDITDKNGVIRTRTGWEGWNDISMALFRATAGSDAGFEIFNKWCAKNKFKYDPTYTRYSWYRRYKRSPPRGIGAGTILALSTEEHPGWIGIWNEEHAVEIKQAKIEQSKENIEKAIQTGHYEIKITSGSNSNVYETEQYLIASGVPIYVYGRTLVRPITIEVRAMPDKLTKVAQLFDIEPNYLSLIANEKITYLKWNVKDKVWNPTDPPLKIIQGLMSMAGHWKFPVITGVISTPTMRYDGSILSEPGYDKATRLLLVDPPKLTDWNERCSYDDAIRAKNVIGELLSEFSFVDDIALAVAYSSIITPIVRGAFQVAPMHVNKAPTPASGKSYLFDVVAAIAIGQRMPTMAAGRNDEETEKRLGASLLVGQPLINIDNVNGELGGDALCQYIERPIVNIRVLGKSEVRTVEASSTTLYATGNNITLVGDITRRSLICTLDPNMERPEMKEYKKNPVNMVMANRGKYIAACLTICKAYMQAGSPNRAKRLGSFEGWSDVVRSALIWVGLADPVLSMELSRTEDPRLMDLEAVLTQWSRVIGTGEVNAVYLNKVIEYCDEKLDKRGYDQFVLKYPDFRDAICRVASVYGRPPDLKRLSYWARSNKGRLINNSKLVSRSAPSGGGSARWFVQRGDNPRDATAGLKDQTNVVGMEQARDKHVDF